MSHDTTIRHARFDFIAASWRTVDDIEAALVKHGFEVRARDEDVLTGDPSFTIVTSGHGFASRLNAVMVLVGLVRVTELDATGERPVVLILVKPFKEGGHLQQRASFCAALREAGFEVVSCSEEPGGATARIRGLREAPYWRELLASVVGGVRGKWEIMD